MIPSRFIGRGMALLALLLFASGAPGAEKARLQLKWHHAFQFAGYYAAQAQDYYQAAGLEVEFLLPQPGEDPLQSVVQGKAEFGVGSTELLLLRENGAPVVVLAAIFQHSPSAFLTLKKQGLQTVHDLAGSKVVLGPDTTELCAYLQEEGIAAHISRRTPFSYDIQELLSGKADAMAVLVTDQPFLLEQAGRDYLLYSPRAAGIDFYGDNLFTTEGLLKRKPELVKNFREASLKGWDYAMRHQEEVARLIYDRYSQKRSLEHLLFEAREMEPLLQTSLVEVGQMYPGRWRSIIETYAGLGLLQPKVDLKRFLYDPNPSPRDLTWFYVILATVASLLVLVALAAIRFARLSAALARSTQERLEQQARLLALEEERKSLRKQQRLIRDLHDGLGATSANLELLAERGRREGQADCKDKAFERISRLAQETSLEVRSLMDSLEVGGIGWGEVIENCRSRAALVFDPVGVHWEMAVTGTVPDGGLPSLAGLSLMRLLREAMNNILKHAHARTVRLHFVFGPERCCLTLQDDGCGFQPDPARPGRGLKNMRQRIEELGGAMRLETSLCENQRIKAVTPERARPCPRDSLNPDQLTGAGSGSDRLIEVFSCGEGVGVRLMFEIPLPIQFHDTSAPSPGGRS